uniref:Metallothionein n=1 Tax=Hebeloma cylindrosporum TaxID=76867 RepID=B6C962_HEBCY|nr:metallothionein [Hebeloma cylindrosporum]
MQIVQNSLVSQSSGCTCTSCKCGSNCTCGAPVNQSSGCGSSSCTCTSCTCKAGECKC